MKQTLLLTACFWSLCLSMALGSGQGSPSAGRVEVQSTTPYGFNNVRHFGAKGDGITDDRLAIQAAIDDAVSHDKAGILVPSGTYRVSRASAPGQRWSLELNGVRDFTVLGQGPASVVKLVDTTAPTGDWHVFILHNGCQRVLFQDLVVDGNRLGLTSPDEQSHGIEVEDATFDLAIDNCIVRDCFGDGVRMVGTDQGAGGQNVKRVRIENTLFQTNKRSGLGIQRALEQILVAHCLFDSTVTDQSIDFEPTGSDAPSEMVIDGCVINHTNQSVAVSLSGVSGPDPVTRVKFTNNLVFGGQVFCTDIAQATIQNNTILVPNVGGNRIPLYVQRGGDSLLISGNQIVNENTQTEAALGVAEVNGRQVTRAILSNNQCFTVNGSGISCLSSDDVAIEGNMVVATGPCAHGIFVRSESSGMDGISVRDNDVMIEGAGSLIYGIRVASGANPIGQLSLIGNSVRGATQGIRFENPNFTQTPVCALNRIDAGVTSPLVGFASLPEKCVIASGAVSSGGTAAATGGGRTLIGTGDPNSLVRGNVGDVFQRLDGGAGSTMYVKESGNGTTTGWTAK